MVKASDIGEKIKNYRRICGLTQVELSDRLGVSDKTVSSWEINRTEPTMGMVEKMALIFECSKSDLLGWSDKLPGADTDLLVDIAVDDKMQQFLIEFRQLNAEHQSQIFELTSFLLAKEKGG